MEGNTTSDWPKPYGLAIQRLRYFKICKTFQKKARDFLRMVDECRAVTAMGFNPT